MSNKQQRLKSGQHIEAAEKIRAGVPISVEEWCALEGCSRQQWYTRVARGEAPAFYYNGGIVRIASADYLAWIEVMKPAKKPRAGQTLAVAEPATA